MHTPDMKIFKFAITFKRKRAGRTGVEAIVHARSIEAAKAHLASKYPGADLGRPIELPSAPAHFVLADLVDDTK